MRLLRGTIQLFAGLKVIINRFFKTGTQFCNGFTVKTDDIIDACNMTDKATIVLTIVNPSGISFMNHCVHGVIPACSRKRRASRTWYGFASF